MNPLFIARILTILSLSSITLLAQDDRLDDFSLDELPEEDTSIPYFAVGGGVITTFFTPDLDILNQQVSSFLEDGQELSTPILMVGGQGFSSIGIIENVRVGFVSMGGTEEITTTSDNIMESFEYSIGFNAISVDYGFTVARGLVILPGVMLGWGSIDITAAQSEGVRDYEGTFNFSGENRMRQLSSSHISVQPNLNIEYALPISTPRLFMLRLNAGYNVTASMGDWEVDGITSVNNVPNDINATGLTYQIGLFVGLFNN
jgi:hypothetical protein